MSLNKMSNKEYRQEPGLSSTDLKTMVKSMATWKYLKENPDSKDSEALLFGRLYHLLCLEPYKLNKEFIVIKDFNCASKEGKQAYAEFVENEIGRPLTDAEKKYKDSITSALMSCGKDVVTEEQYEKAMAMRDALYATPFAKKLLYGQHEDSFFWEDKDTGLMCKCRPDSYGQVGNVNVCVDLKTCNDAETDAFMKSAIKLNYDIQAAHYCEGLKATFGKEFKFVFIAQEKTAPYLVNILEADEDFMRSGLELRQLMLEQYQECVKRDEWPGLMGFSDEAEINTLGVPGWLKKAYESDNGGDL